MLQLQIITLISIILPLINCLTSLENLYDTIFKNYRAGIRPAVIDPANNTLMPTTIYIRPALYRLIDVNEADETLTVAQWFLMKWNDSRLSWNSSNHNNIKKITVPDRNVWLPDVKMYEMLDVVRSEVMPYYASIADNGEIVYSNSLVMKSQCQLDVKEFPYDRQNCQMSYACWSHGGEAIVLKSLTGNTADKSEYKANAEWTLVDYTAEEVVQHYSTGDWYEVRFNIILERKPGYYLLTLTLPTFMIVTIAILGLFSPFDAQQNRQERVTLGLTALLTIAVILMMVADLMPKSSIDFPLLGDYILFEMIIISIATIIAVTIMYLHSQAAFNKPVPDLLYKITFLNKLKTQKHSKGTGWTLNNNRNGTAATPLSVHSKKEDQIQALYHILGLLQHYKTKFDEMDESEELMGHWMQVCFRLDVICLCAFMLFQAIVSAMYLKMFG